MSPEDVNQESDRRRVLKAKYRETFEWLSALLFKHDPIQLDFETNTDEYDPEAGTILPRLASCASEDDVLQVVSEEFVRWFGQEYGDREGYREIASEIWRDRPRWNEIEE